MNDLLFVLNSISQYDMLIKQQPETRACIVVTAVTIVTDHDVYNNATAPSQMYCPIFKH